MVTANLSAAIGFIQQGKLRALAVTSKERVRQLPDVPAAAETLPGFENLGWFGFMAPTGTPAPVIDKIYRDTAVVWFTQTLKGPSQGKPITIVYQYVDVWVMRDGRWQCVASQSTKKSTD